MLNSIFNTFKFRLSNNKNRIKLLRKMGMNISETALVAGNVQFGSEPYLIKIGEHTKITGGVHFITHDGGVEVLRNLNLLPDADVFGMITIGDNVFIGNYAAILPGITIGNNVVIGYGCIVTKDIPDNSVVAGVPGKVIKNIDEYYEGIKENVDYTKHMSATEKKIYLLQKFSLVEKDM